MDGPNSTTGIVYYSRSGHSERVASKLAIMLHGKMIPLQAPRYAPRIFGYMRAGYDSLRQTCVLPPQAFASLAEFDRLVVCGPVWTSYPATPLRALLRSDMDKPETIALFVTTGGHSPAEKAWKVAELDLGRPFLATASLANSLEDTKEEELIIDTFLNELGAQGQKTSMN
ncbi:hypothetical protein KX928_00630 [Roseobacter sp. YSTF-M11]|uniref:Flavodoxin-like domain-containing protein n=1 Tax=Roseobacter insulae TaxID=2859783 RepID=A0A9X1FR74_9RHOB|nr:hypothetical protein [Roseobacter insulae]MBW4706284.1 hypothetical protein [Roseobacter insulae]